MAVLSSIVTTVNCDLCPYEGSLVFLMRGPSFATLERRLLIALAASQGGSVTGSYAFLTCTIPIIFRHYPLVIYKIGMANMHKKVHRGGWVMTAG